MGNGYTCVCALMCLSPEHSGKSRAFKPLFQWNRTYFNHFCCSLCRCVCACMWCVCVHPVVSVAQHLGPLHLSRLQMYSERKEEEFHCCWNNKRLCLHTGPHTVKLSFCYHSLLDSLLPLCPYANKTGFFL